MSGEDRQDGSGSVRRFFGYALMAIGWLIAATAGLCTGIGLIIGIAGIVSGSDAGIFQMAILFGGGPIIVGILMIVLGNRLVRPRKPPAADTANGPGGTGPGQERQP